jgi:hypothetical protein
MIGREIDEVFDRLGPAEFQIDRLAGGVIMFTGTFRRAKTPAGRNLIPVEDVVGLLDAEIEANGTLEDCRRFLVNTVMNADG